MTVRLTIDGKTIEVEEGTRLLDAARNNGLNIPTLCFHRDLTPTGNCRICVVEVQGQRFLQAACVTNVWEGMVVQTHSAKVVQSRKLALELMLANHPQECLVCDSSGSCELQDLAYSMGVRERLFEGRRKEHPVDASSHSVVRNAEKCILCGACIAVCKKDAMRAEKTGCTIFVGGKMGRKPAQGKKLIELADEERLFSILEKSLEYYRREGLDGERFGDLIDRLGIENYLASLGMV